MVNDINIFDTSGDVGGILPQRLDAPGPMASYFTRPMVPSPASRRRDALKGIAQFVPFLGGEIAKYDNDKLGMALSSLDALGPAGTAAKGAVLVGKQAAKKGIGSLDQAKDMMFVHNTSEDAIKSFDQMGGIPSPSIAVQTADVPLKGFGEIQLIGKPKNFDPAVDPRNAVYSADAYTPRAPKKIRLAKEGAAEKIKKDYASLLPGMMSKNNFKAALLDRAVRGLENLTANKGAQVLGDNSEAVDFFFRSDFSKLKFLKDTGKKIDPKQVNFTGREYKQWLAKEKDKYLSQDGVFTYFDDFEETMVTKPYTLENATRNMIEETQRGGEGGMAGSFGGNRLRALMSEKMTDLSDIKGQRSRIQEHPGYGDPEIQVEDILTKASDEMHWTDAMPFQDLANESDNFVNQIGMNLENGDTIENAVYSAFRFFDIDPPGGMSGNIIDVFKQNAARNVEYLEAKPMRAVGFDEFAGAIVPPKTSQEVIDILENRGLKVIKNDLETDFIKTKARQQFKDQMFSVAPIAGAGGITALALNDNLAEENRGLGSIPPRQ